MTMHSCHRRFHLGYLPDDLVINHLARARESRRFVAQGYQHELQGC